MFQCRSQWGEKSDSGLIQLQCLYMSLYVSVLFCACLHSRLVRDCLHCLLFLCAFFPSLSFPSRADIAQITHLLLGGRRLRSTMTVTVWRGRRTTIRCCYGKISPTTTYPAPSPTAPALSTATETLKKRWVYRRYTPPFRSLGSVRFLKGSLGPLVVKKTKTHFAEEHCFGSSVDNALQWTRIYLFNKIP